jgi:hypothetical protein
MSKDNEIKAAIALGTLRVVDINPKTIKKVAEEDTLCQLANTFQYFWTKLWARWDYDNDDWPFTTEIYDYEVFLATADLLCERLKHSQPLLCKAVEFSVNKWKGEYKHLFEE